MFLRSVLRFKTLRFQGISLHACAVPELARRRRSRRQILNSLLYIARGRIYKLLNAQNGHFRFKSHTHTHTHTQNKSMNAKTYFYIY